ncbi:MAG: DUF1080 domain-containing protein [Bacteroidales bacterium]|nr:DUF1080 domain-containing protein [Bacteroidales bacterium]
MKKIYSILILLALAVSLHAQDARNRTVQTIVADVLSAMPAQNSADFETQIGDLAKAAPQSVIEVASKLKPAGEGVKNAIYEYALTGLVSYVNNPAHSEKKADVLKGLQDAAKACTDTYNKELLTSLQRMLGEYTAPEQEPAMSVKEAKALLKNGATHEMCLAADAIMNADPSKAWKTVASALKSDNKVLRNSVIQNATKIVGASALVPLFTGKFKKLSSDAKVDVLNWFGNNKIASVANIVNSAIGEGGDVTKAAIAAAGKIGGSVAAKNLIAQLGGDLAPDALTALKSFKGDIKEDVKDALAAAFSKALQSKDAKDYGTLINILDLASARKMKNVAPVVYSMIGCDNGTISSLGTKALSNFVGKDDISKVGALLDGNAANVKDYTEALKAAIHTLAPAEQYAQVSSLAAKAKNVENYFPVLASTGTDEAVADLEKAYEGGSGAALLSLAAIDNYKATPILLKAVKSDKGLAASLLPRFISLVNDNETNLDRKRAFLGEALGLAGTKDLKTMALNALSNVPTMKSFLLAGKYLDDKDAAYAAAGAVKNIASKTKEEINYDDLKSNLEKAVKIFKAAGGADDGYAVDEIGQLLEKAKPFEVSQLTAEEKKQGFEMLFDGTNLDKWQGDLEGYIPVNGAIYVSANFGSTGNLYTKKEYRNFVYRFEFCFLREGVNNGVGVRTPMGVDAAYEGMCEVQILDHDAQAYEGWLREYQVHGSVYGVIPAKRIVHKPLGEWSTEEIRVEGDRIKVTVNGQVIVDGNIRTACKGHNVDPKGSNENPYTVDHRNHPGMFNRKGYISFCGHGEGLKIRNVRILDLGDRK